MENLIIFNSMTAAMKAREILRRHGIATRMTKTPGRLRRGTCSYSLRVKPDTERAVEILGKHGLPFAGTAADAP